MRASEPRTLPDGFVPGGRRWTRAIVTGTSALSSMLLHGGVLAAALYWIEWRPGAIERPTEAISIELLESAVIEAVEASASLEAAASPASVQAVSGDVQDSASAAKAEQLPVKGPEQQVAATEAPPEVQAREQSAFGQDILKGADEDAVPVGQQEEKASVAPSKVEPAKEEPNRPKRTKTVARETEEKPAPSHRKGSAQSRAAKSSTASPSRVSGSTGSALNYAAIVRARVAARKPAGGGRRGTVVVSFGVTRSGGIGYASISRSSGDASLDHSVLFAVRSAGPFPTPPPNANLRFAMPFYFR